MFYQIIINDQILRELYIPFVLFITFYGYQLSLLFFYEYYKQRNESFGFNQIHLGYGLFFVIGTTALSYRGLVQIFLWNSKYYFLFFTISETLLLISFGFLLLVISFKTFNIVLNIKLTKFFIVLTIIAIFLNIFVIMSIIRRLTNIIFFIIIGFYLIYFQFSLCKHSTGIVNKRLILISFGGLFLFLGELSIRMDSQILILGSYFFQMLGIGLLTVGMVIIFLGIYKFPAFLEFQWEKNLLKLYIINRNNLKTLYSLDLRPIVNSLVIDSISNESERNKIIDRDNRLFSGLPGISVIIEKCTNIQIEETNRIKHGEHTILFQYGDNNFSYLMFALLIKKEMNSGDYFLKIVKEQFQSFFKEILSDPQYSESISETIFKSFDIIIKNLIKT